MNSLNNLIQQMAEFSNDDVAAKIPPLEQWHPALSGDIDIQIKSNGEWLHEGAVIGRKPLVKLFSSIIKKEESEYFLVTPVEKWRIQVEDAPLLITESIQKQVDGIVCVMLKTLVGDVVSLSDKHPLFMRDQKPYVLVRGNLEALVHRNVFYQWQELLAEHEGKHGIWSSENFFALE